MEVVIFYLEEGYMAVDDPADNAFPYTVLVGLKHEVDKPLDVLCYRRLISGPFRWSIFPSDAVDMVDSL